VSPVMSSGRCMVRTRGRPRAPDAANDLGCLTWTAAGSTGLREGGGLVPGGAATRVIRPPRSVSAAVLHGKGVAQDRAEAMRWYRLAADQGTRWPSATSARCTSRGPVSRRTFDERRVRGCDGRPSKGARPTARASGGSTRAAAGCRRTRRGPLLVSEGGRQGMPPRCGRSGDTTAKGEVCHRTMPRRSSGTGGGRPRGVYAENTLGYLLREPAWGSSGTTSRPRPGSAEPRPGSCRRPSSTWPFDTSAGRVCRSPTARPPSCTGGRPTRATPTP